MTYKCIRSFESVKGITFIKNRVIPLCVYLNLSESEKENFIPV